MIQVFVESFIIIYQARKCLSILSFWEDLLARFVEECRSERTEKILFL